MTEQIETKFNELMECNINFSSKCNSLIDQLLITEDKVNIEHTHRFMMMLKSTHCHMEKLLQEVGWHFRSTFCNKPLSCLCMICDLKDSSCEHVMYDKEQASDFEIVSNEVLQDRIINYHKMPYERI